MLRAMPGLESARWRYRVPCYWIVDTPARVLEAYGLGTQGYGLVERAQGEAPVSLPPFPDLPLVPAEPWRH